MFEKTEAVARQMDKLGWDTLWLAEHHFQREGYEVLPNIPDGGGASAHLTEKLKIGCGFNITPMWHPLRLAEDHAVADILTKGPHGVRRRPRLPHAGGRDLRQPDPGPGSQPRAVRGAGRDPVAPPTATAFSHRGKHYTCRRTCPIAAIR